MSHSRLINYDISVFRIRSSSASDDYDDDVNDFDDGDDDFHDDDDDVTVCSVEVMHSFRVGPM